MTCHRRSEASASRRQENEAGRTDQLRIRTLTFDDLFHAGVIGLAGAQHRDLLGMKKTARHGELGHAMALRPGDEIAAVGLLAGGDKDDLLALTLVGDADGGVVVIGP